MDIKSYLELEELHEQLADSDPKLIKEIKYLNDRDIAFRIIEIK